LSLCPRVAGRQDHDHLAALHAGLILDLGDFLEVGLDLLQELHAQFRVRQLAAPEAQGDLHLVAFFEEAVHRAGLHVVVVRVDVGAELDLLDLHHLLPLARLVLLLLLLELELAIVQDLANGRIRVGHDLDQIEAGLRGGFESRRRGHDALLLALLIDQQDARNADVLVDARPFLLGRRLHGAANRQSS